MDIHVYRVADSRGNRSHAVASETSDTIFVSGLERRDGLPVAFESDCHHLREWAELHGFTCEHHVVTLDIENRRLSLWVEELRFQPIPSRAD